MQAFNAKGKPRLDFSSLVAGAIRVGLEYALEWLGDGALLDTHALFPTPSYDTGYREILERLEKPERSLGAIQHIGA